MPMKVEQISVQDAMKQGLKLPFAFIRTLSSVTFGKTPGEPGTDILEARFFDASQEIRVFETDAQLAAVKKTAEQDDVGSCLTYEIQNRKFGRSFTVFQTYGFDEDGQAFIADTRLTGWKGEAENG